jgi:hypothetical protein
MTTWDRYNKVIVAINDIDIAMIGDEDQHRLHQAEKAKSILRDLAADYCNLAITTNTRHGAARRRGAVEGR